jgi:hypothetical protein
LPEMTTSNSHALHKIPRPALSLGLAGLVPFWGLAISIIVLDTPMKDFAVQLKITYGAVILSFLGGMHWGLAAVNKRHENWLSLGWGITPALIAWGALFLQPSLGLILLIIGFLAAAIIDFRIFVSNNSNAWFGMLRTVLSIGTITALLLTLSFGNIF